jgi:hypothetical protein
MSSFNSKGLRALKVQEVKKQKRHIREYNKIMKDIENIVPKILHKYPNVEFDEDNINDYIKQFYYRDLDAIEKFYLLGKIHYAKNQLT